ncbi:MAG: hypothetical protein GVY21_05185 [Gammaproteobacteria bacterium]|jgi:alkylation response protein AidB-like acyl-CoA dehydrogenase|nr:hypothetical protein [Gammaproteobacteria bacterium]
MSHSEFDGVAAARRIAGVLSEHCQYGERSGALPTASVDALQQAGMLRLWRPRALGGHEVSPRDYGRIAEEIARSDSAAAWLMMANANTTFDLRLADERFVEEVFASEDVIVCETFNRPLQGRVVDGGFEVSGSTPFASGCRHAHWIGHTAVIDERFLLMFHPAGALTIEDDWHTLGLRGTSSNTVTADAVFVPEHRVIEFAAAPPINRHFDSPLYRLPEGILTTTFAPVSLGLLAAALDEASGIAARKQPFASATTLKHRPLAQAGFGRALASYRAARALYHQTLAAAFERAVNDEPFELTDKADLFLTCAHVLQSCADATRQVARVVGTSAIYEGSVVERAVRDTEVIAHHAFGAEGRFATVAQAYWGLDVDFPLLAMD